MPSGRSCVMLVLLVTGASGCVPASTPDAPRPVPVSSAVAPGSASAPTAVSVAPSVTPVMSAPPASSAASPPWPPAPPGVATTFCLPGVLDALAEDACYLLPERPTTTLLVYLPGLMPPSPESPEKRGVETVVANACRRAGVAALVPRGITRDALAAPGRDPKGMGGYFTWPTADDAYRTHAAALVARIQAHRRALEALVGAPFTRVLLGGSSAGAYFVAHLALRGELPADGYAVLSGGSGRPSPHLADLPRRPLYVGYGDGDLVGPKAEEVARQARAAGWPVKVAVHHTGHGSREIYLDEAFAFFGVTAR